MLQYALVFDAALIEFALFIVALFNVVLCQCSTDLFCTINVKSFNDALFDVALLTVAQLNVLLF